MGHALPVKIATPGRRASRLPVRSLRSAPVAVLIAILMVVIATVPFEARVAAQGKPGVDVRGTWDWITDSAQQGKTYYYPSRLSLVLETQDVETGKVSGTVTGSSACGEPPWSKRSTPRRSAVAPCKGRFLPARGVVERDTIEITMGIFVATAKLVVRDGKLTASGEWHHTGKDFTSTIRGTLVEPLVVTGDRSSATFVICNRDLLAQDDLALLTCTASVADASGRTPAMRPTGSVAWTTDAGQVAPRSCLLSGSVGSVASCTVQVTARTTDIPMGTAPPVTAAYPGSDEFAPSSGSPRLYGAARGFTASDLYGPGCNPAAIPTTSVGCGDPVDPATGSLSLETADLAVVRPGLALAVVRSYDSAAAAAGVGGRFGSGWGDDHGARLEEGPGRKVTVHLGTGATVPFTVRGNRITSPDWVTAALRRGPRKGWTLTFADQGRLVFDRKGRLVTIDDRRREPVTLAYGEAGALIAATDGAGQALTYASDVEGRVTSVSDPTGRTVGYEYDDTGDLVAVTDVAGDVTRYTYDEDHRLTSITDATGATATTSYDARGRVREQVDPLGNTLSFEYLGAFPELMTIATDGAGVRHAFMYGRGVLVQETRALGTDVEATTHYLHDERLAEVAVIDPAGALWRTTRDDAGRVLTSTDPLDRITTFAYDEDGDVVSVTTPMGLVTRIGYDERKLPRSMTVAAGTESEATLIVARDDPDHPSWVTGVTDLAGATTTIGHDELGRIAGFTDALGAAWAATRDDHGWVTTVTDPLGTTASVIRDARGMVTSSTDPLGASSSLELDPVGRAVSVTDALGNTTTLTRDAAGRPLSLGLADGTTVRAARDARGSLLTQTNALGATSIIELDALGRRTAWTDPLGNTWRWAYDAVGKRVSTTDPLGRTTRYTWDAASQLVGVDYPEGTPDVTFEYDLDGRRISMSDGTGRTTYGWDVLGRLVEVVDGSGARVATTWDAGGRLDQLTYPDGLVVDHDYDAGGRLVGLRDSLGHESRFGYDAAGRLVTAILGDGSTTSWTYDARGDVLSVDAVGVEPILSVAYERDAAGRVTGTADASAGQSTTSYDVRGRLIGMGTHGFELDAAGDLTSLREQSMRYDAAGRLLSEGSDAVSHEYDAAGQRIRSSNDSGETSYVWDAAGRLVAAGASSATYDGDGMRATLSPADGTTHRFTWLRTGSLPTLLDDGIWRYIQGPTGPIAQVDDEGNVLWLHRDLTGNVRALTDDRAAVVATFAWDAYGEQVAHNGDATTRLGYHGRWADPVTGLQVLPARVYDPATGQFLSVDPSVIATHHPYAFAAGDPLGATDPSGADPKPVTVLAGHGGWYGSSGFVTVPEGTTVIFHQPAGSPITDPYGLSIEEGAPIKYAEVYGPGSRIPDYTLAKPEDLVTLPSSVTVTQDTQLSSLLKPGMGTVHWAACRTASGSDRSIVNSSLAWRPITTYGQDPASPDADWGGLTATTIWSPADHESNNGHIDAPLWDAHGPVLDPWRNSMPVEFDPAWYDWDSQDILPTS